ncbi:MAG: hydantoinase B/oxoprolinase family protein [Betaproteobacteria bacterium]|nr:hydantoinase B/oxoprolinase family protein [Betaproteobacteria bacterium]
MNAGDRIALEPMDPITLEVLRNRLAMINDEQGRVASQLSGSPVVYEAKDFNSALLTPEGEGLFVGIYMTRLSLCLNGFAKTVIGNFKDNPGYEEGDAYVTNDPWAGAAHMNDFLMIAPIFHRGTLVCWTGLAMHEVDVGGPNPGSFTVGSPDVFGEAPLIPPVKMVERGIIRNDIEALLIRNSRTSRLNGLNMRARIAAINRTRQRIKEVIAEYGLETVMQAQRGILDLARTSFARRLRSLPDGAWTSEGFLDHDGNENRLYRICLAMTKRGDHLTFDFTGTDAQARGAVNCARTGLESGILSAVLPMLCYDIPWTTGGIMPMLEIISAEGTINNALHPAAVSMATVSAIFATSHVTSGAIAKMLACSSLHDEIQANWSPAWQGVTMAGHFAGGRPFTAVLLDETGGSGARGWKDGIDAGGLPGSPAMAIANVEVYEKEHPILYVYRRQAPDTGGQGMYRGGVGTEGMMIPHRNEGPIDLTRIAHGVSQPEAQGLYGGYPSSVQVTLLLRDSDHRRQFAQRHIPVSVEALRAASIEPMQAKQRTLLNPEDAIVIVCAGGGGYGDPLQRDPAKVLGDVASGLVSERVARDIYGVAVRDVDGKRAPQIDSESTAFLRKAIRERRLSEGRQPPARAQQAPTGREASGVLAQSIGAALDRAAGEGLAQYVCRHCKRPIGGANQDPKSGALARLVKMESLSPWNKYGLVDEIAVREFCCPGCAHLIAVEVRRRDDPILYDTRLG